MSILSLNVNYNSNYSELCNIGKKYDTDKSSQRNNVTNHRHCHPYTLFYDSLFKDYKNDNLNIAELGILDGASLLMWQEYLTNANIYGFEYYDVLINNFKNNFNNERITLSPIDVKNKDSISDNFQNLNIKYDIIIDDTTHEFEDQINIIENVYQYLKPGGILIIEDIFKSYNENDYITRLQPILHEFQDYYFISLDHVNRNSTGWDNDKLFILVKNGGEPIFKNKNKITIITPSYRTDNLIKLKNSINFDYINEWIIVYDGSKITENPNIFINEKIKEFLYKGDGISGNPQRNFALDNITIEDTYIYFLDDDNIIHPNFYKLLDIIDKNKIYTFDQENRIKGNNINVCYIDSAMFLIDYNICKGIKWIPHEYGADGYYIKECYNNNKNKHVYLNNNLCYYNYIYFSNMIETYKTLIENAFQNAENNISKITNDIIIMEGMSGTKTRHFYNNLLHIEDARYLEIGTWKGSSVCSAMFGNKAKITCIDNWSEFGGPKDDFLVNFEKFKGENDANFIEDDCYKVDVSSLSKFNIYMYDGNHSNKSHYKALLHYYDCLDDIFIFIVDDWNWIDVRDGTMNSIRELNLKILYEKEIRLTWDNSVTPEPELSQNWWNGIYIAILQK